MGATAEPGSGPRGHASRSGRSGRAAGPPGASAAGSGVIGPEFAQATFAGTPDALVVVDDGGRIVEFNPAAEEVYGWRREDVLGRDMVRLLVPAHRRRAYRAMVRRYARTGDETALRDFHRKSATSALRSDGTEFATESTIVPLAVDGKRFFCEHVRDKSDLAHATSALIASEQRFRLLSTLAPVGILQADADGEPVFVNDRWCALTGLSAEQALDRGWAGLLGPGRAESVEDQWENARRAGEEFRAEILLRPRQGAATWVQGAAVPLRDERGHMIGYLGTMTDITAIKAAEAERERVLAAEREARWQAAENTERLTRLVTALPGAVLVEDERRRVVLVNESFCEAFRLPAAPAELIGSDAESVLAQTQHAAADPGKFLLRTGQIAATRELVVDEEIVLGDGRIYDLDYVPIFVGAMWHGQLWIYWDVTERRVLERQRERLLAAELKARKATEAARRRLDEQNQRLRELDKFKSDFMATLSHELRTPLTSIISFTGLLREAEPSMPAQAGEFLDIIERNSDRLLRMVSDLLLLAHLEAGSLPLDLADVPVAELTEEAARARSAPAYRRGIMLEVSAGDGPPIRADRHRMLQVLDNLISNAIKFTDPGGSVAVTARFTGGEWRIDVADSGIGIPAEELEKIFDRFFRASNARIDAAPGTGLGLSVVKAIVDLHGGRLDVSSTPGRGTTFTIVIRASR